MALFFSTKLPEEVSKQIGISAVCLLDVSMFLVGPCMYEKRDEHARCTNAFYLYSYIWNVHMHISMRTYMYICAS